MRPDWSESRAPPGTNARIGLTHRGIANRETAGDMEIVAHHRSPRPADAAAVLAALRSTLDSVADRIEIDVLPQGSGLVVAHDARVVRGVAGLALDDALELFAGDEHRTLLADLKHGDAAAGLADALAARGLGPRTIVCGEELAPALHAAARAGAAAAWTLPAGRGDHPDPRAGPFGLSTRRARARVRQAATWALTEGGCAAVCVDRRFVDAHLADAVRGRAGRLYAWTADEDREIRRLIGLGVDAITTNDPAAVARARDATRSAA